MSVRSVSRLGGEDDPAEHLAGCYLLVGQRGLLQRQYLVDHAAQLAAARGGEKLGDPDPWHGFRLVIERLFELNACNRELAAALTAAFPRALNFAADREHALNSLAELARRAKETGHLRPDFALNDLILMLQAARGLHATSPATLAAASRRFVSLAIQAFQAAAPEDTGTLRAR